MLSSVATQENGRSAYTKKRSNVLTGQHLWFHASEFPRSGYTAATARSLGPTLKSINVLVQHHETKV